MAITSMSSEEFKVISLVESIPQEIYEASIKVANLETQIVALKNSMLPIRNAIESEVYSSKVYSNDPSRKAAVTAFLMADDEHRAMSEELTSAEAKLRIATAEWQLCRDLFSVAMMVPQSVPVSQMQRGISGECVQNLSASAEDKRQQAESLLAAKYGRNTEGLGAS